MKASLRSVRISPKKAGLIAQMIRGMSVPDARDVLSRTHKKGARLLEDLLESAAANARNNDSQTPEGLVIKTIVVNKAQTFHRGIPMARGRMRRIKKFLSHIDMTLGLHMDEENETKETKDSKETKEKTEKKASTTAKTPVKKTAAKSDSAKGSTTKKTSATPKPSAAPKTKKPSSSTK